MSAHKQKITPVTTAKPTNGLQKSNMHNARQIGICFSSGGLSNIEDVCDHFPPPSKPSKAEKAGWEAESKASSYHVPVKGFLMQS